MKNLLLFTIGLLVLFHTKANPLDPPKSDVELSVNAQTLESPTPAVDFPSYDASLDVLKHRSCKGRGVLGGTCSATCVQKYLCGCVSEFFGCYCECSPPDEADT